jgi:hypothetical protein
MIIDLTRYSEPDFPIQSFSEVTNQLSTELLKKICNVSGIESDLEALRLELGKDLYRFHRSSTNGPVWNPDPQRREFKNLQTTVERLIKGLEGLTDENQSDIDDEIQYRTPFNRQFYFPQQMDYWNANANSVQKAKNLLTMITWAAKRVTEKTENELSFGRRTQNSHLDYLILNLSITFEGRSKKTASSQCYYSDIVDGYAGQYFDFVSLILDNFAPSSYQSRGALGKRIVRLLKVKAS